MTKDVNKLPFAAKAGGGAPWPKPDVTNYHAQLGLSDEGRAIKGVVVCYVLSLESVKWLGLGTCARSEGLVVPCCGQQDGYQGQVLQHPKVT